LFIDLAKLARISIPPSSSTAFATLAFTDKFAIACKFIRFRGYTRRYSSDQVFLWSDLQERHHTVHINCTMVMHAKGIGY
jgi:hypothetical protein